MGSLSPGLGSWTAFLDLPWAREPTVLKGETERKEADNLRSFDMCDGRLFRENSTKQENWNNIFKVLETKQTTPTRKNVSVQLSFTHEGER